VNLGNKTPGENILKGIYFFGKFFLYLRLKIFLGKKPGVLNVQKMPGNRSWSNGWK
jgi:hypothetical protein